MKTKGKKLLPMTNQTKKISAKPAKVKGRIPPPPGPEASWDEQAAYYDKYSVPQLERAGYLHNANEPEFFAELALSAKSQRKREQVNISLDSVSITKLQALAKRKHLSPATLARCWILERLELEQTGR